MANRGQKALSTGAAGAGVGAQVGGGYGAIIGGAIGAGVGFFQGDDEEPTFTAPSFSDIDLQTENPELYEDLMEMYAQADALEREYLSRQAGPSYLDRAEIADVNSGIQNRMSHQGILGSSVGVAAAADADTMLREKINERAMQEAQQMKAAWFAQQNAAMNAKRAMQQDVMSGLMAEKTGQYTADREDVAANNQFYSGLFNGGMQMAGTAYNNDRMDQRMSMYRTPAEWNSGYEQAPNFYAPSSQPAGYDPNAPFWKR